MIPSSSESRDACGSLSLREALFSTVGFIRLGPISFTQREVEIVRGRRNGIIRRCFHRTSSEYPNYGGRGIGVCDEWRDTELGSDRFVEWAWLSGFEVELHIDRIDNNSGYGPGNCRWVTRKENCRNTRASHVITAWGETKCGAAWAEDERCSVDYETMMGRIRNGRDVEWSISAPVKHWVRRSVVRRGRRYEAFGESKTLAEWVEDERFSGVGKSTLKNRFASDLWTNEDAISQPVYWKTNAVLYEAFGERKTVTEWLVDVRCPSKSRKCLRNRLRGTKLTNEDAIVFPVHWKRSSER